MLRLVGAFLEDLIQKIRDEIYRFYEIWVRGLSCAQLMNKPCGHACECDARPNQIATALYLEDLILFFFLTRRI